MYIQHSQSLQLAMLLRHLGHAVILASAPCHLSAADSLLASTN